jgi:archaellin
MLAIGAIGAGVVIVVIAVVVAIIVALVVASIRGHRKAKSKVTERNYQPDQASLVNEYVVYPVDEPSATSTTPSKTV